MKKKKFVLTRRMVTILTVIILLLFTFLLWIFIKSQQQISQAEKETTDLVSLDYKIKTVKDFNWTTFDESTFSMEFIDDKNALHYAIIKAEGGDIQYYTPQEIISKKDALSIAASENNFKDVLNTRLGFIDKEPVWEVVFKNDKGLLTYYYINAKNGEWIQTIGNL